MDNTKFRLTAGILLSLSIFHQCSGQQNTIFNQSPFQRRQQTPQLRQQLQQTQQRQVFPNTLPVLNPPISPIAPLNTLTPITPIVPQQGIFRGYNPENYVPITAYQNELNYDGSFSYGYAAGDGTTAQAQGYVKNLGYGEAVEAQVVQGSYSYTSPEGTPITVHYIADENGFRAEGNHLPQQPFQNFLNPAVNPYTQTPFRQVPTQPTLLPGQQLTPLQLQLQQQQQQRGYQQQNIGQYQPGGQQINRIPQQFGFGDFNTQTSFPGGAVGGGGVGDSQKFGVGGQFGGQFGGLGLGNNLNPQQQQQFNQQNLTQQQQQQNLQQQQQAAQQQQLQQNNQLQQQQQQQQQHQQQQNLQNQQQQLATQELRGRPDQFVGPFGFNPYRRFKKATKK